MRKQTLLLLLIFLVALAARFLRAYQQPVVNPDAIRFVDQANQMQHDFPAALRDEPYHPLMAALSLAARPLVRPFFTDDRIANLAALQLIGILAGSLLSLQIFSLARALGAPSYPSLAAAFLWATNHRITSFGPDGLSDMLFLSLFAASLLLAISATRSPHRSVGGLITKFLLSGFLCGLAYLTRPEGLFLLAILIPALLLSPLRKHRRLLTTLAPLAATCLLIGALLAAAPYIALIGNLTHKNPNFHANPDTLSAATPLLQKLYNASAEIILRIRVTLGVGPLILLLSTLLIAPRLWTRPRLRLLIGLWFLGWVLVLYLLYVRSQYIDARHTLILMLLLHAFFALALTIWTRPTHWWMSTDNRLPRKQPAHNRWPKALALILFLAATLPNLYFLTVPPRPEKNTLRSASAFLSDHTPPNIKIYDKDQLLGYYAHRPYARLTTPLDSPSLFATQYSDKIPVPQNAQLLTVFPLTNTDALLLYLIPTTTTTPTH